MSAEIRVPFINLPLHYRDLKTEVLQAVEQVLDHGQFILGMEVQDFENRFAEYCGVSHAVGVSDGTSALFLVMHSLGIGRGDEVITAPNSFLATAAAIAHTGARPVFVDVRDDFNIDPDRVEDAITPHTKAILPVHLTGRPADMTPLLQIAERHRFYVIEDCAQAAGARYHNRAVGSLGIAGCFSMHPLKNLSAAGDGGVVTTNDSDLYNHLCAMRNHGLKENYDCQFWGYNSRLDTVQAAILLVKLNSLDRWTERRRNIASFYQKKLAEFVRVPRERPHEFSVYQTFIIQTERRDELRRDLFHQGIETKVHYTKPIHFQHAARYLDYKAGDFPVAEQQAETMLSLPIYPELTDCQIEEVVHGITSFFR